MATPTYSTDLDTISLCEAGESYIEFTGYAQGDGAAPETDWYLQGSVCASDEANGKTGVGHSIGVDYGSNVTFDTDDCLFAWMQCQAGNAMDIYANGGYRILMGSSLTVYYGWYVGGSDYGRNPYGGWTNVVADPTATAQDTGHGTPTTWRYFGVGFNLVSAIGKGRPLNADAMRWGRGQLAVIGGEADELLLDSYPTSNYSNGGPFSGYQAYKGYSQTFTTGTNPGALRKASFYLSQVGTVTGTIYSRLYATTAGAPTGSALAESSRVGSSISGPLAVEDFTFTDNYQMEDDTTYAISCEYDVDDGASNYYNYANDNSSPSHSGTGYRLSKFTSAWIVSGIWDSIFYVYGESSTSGDFGTFVGMASANDTSTARWGLFQEQAGGYLWKGLMSLGTAATAVKFVDSNRNIVIDDTPRTYATFNKIEIKHADSYVSWTGISIAASIPGGLSVGDLSVDADAKILFTTCTFTDMNSFTFHSTSTSANIINTTFRRCGQVTQGLATFNGCIFEESSALVSLLVSDLDVISNSNFISDGSNHAMQLDSNHSGGSFTLLNCTYTDYAASDGSTGNECIYNNSGGHVTINVSGGDVPTIRNGTSATTTVVASIVWNFEIKNASNEIVSGSEFRIYNSGTQTQVFGVETSDGTEVYSFDQSLAGNNVDVVVHTVDEYLYFRQTLARPTSNTTTVLVLTVDRWYSNEATTKTRTWGGRPNDDFRSVKDSYIEDGTPTTPYGSSVDLKLASDISGVDITLFRPNITTIPVGATINTAKLYLYIYSNTYLITRNLVAYPLKRDWVESQVTWNLYSTGNSWESPGGLGANDKGTADAPSTSITNGQTGWISLDVSDSLQDYYDETIPVHYGWWISHGGGGPGELLTIHSREYVVDTSLRPYLEINYTT